MANDSVNFTTPVGRLVEGNLYEGSTTDAENNTLVIKSGPNAGQPRVDYYFALAVPKGAEQHWAQTEWGAKIWEVGHKSFPNGQANSPSFAWKVVDGDSTIPNRRGRKPCDREGFKGHWILRWSSGYAPRIFNANGTQAITETGAVKLGYYVQVNGTIAGNGSQQHPGIYLNHSMVALAGYGDEIVLGPDPASAGFGSAPLPPGASATPVGGMSTVAPPAAPVPLVTGAAPVPTPSPVPIHQVTTAAAPAVPPVTPNPAFLAGPGAPPPPPAAAPAPARQMTAAANGATYEQMVAAGWTDAMLIQHGMMKA